MNINLSTRWIIIGFIWSCVLILTYYNITKINVVLNEFEKEEVLRMDDIFWRRNSQNVTKLLRLKESFVLPVDSTKLGLLSVENSLISLASRHDLKEIIVESHPEQSNETGVPIDLYFKGSFNNILPWLESFEKDYPYLIVKHVKITEDPLVNRSVFKISLYFRYKLPDSDFS